MYFSVVMFATNVCDLYFFCVSLSLLNAFCLEFYSEYFHSALFLFEYARSPIFKPFISF